MDELSVRRFHRVSGEETGGLSAQPDRSAHSLLLERRIYLCDGACLDDHLFLKEPIAGFFEIDRILTGLEVGDCSRSQAFGFGLAGARFIG